eukprot:s98_g30.t1
MMLWRSLELIAWRCRGFPISLTPALLQEELNTACAYVGAPFREWKWWPNTLKAHCLVLFAEERGISSSAAKAALFQALYEEGPDLRELVEIRLILCEEPGGLTLDMIREAMRAELGKSRDELGASIASVREEVAFFSKRVDSIEAGVTRQMDTTNKMLTLVTGNHDKQQEALENIRAKQDAQAASMKAFQGGSTADTEAPKKPALIIGGWPEDQPAAETLKKAQDILRQLDVPLDIVPIPQRWGETDDQRREICKNKSPASERHAGGQPGGGTSEAVDVTVTVEFSTGSVWYNERLSSATLEMPKQAERAGAGWVKLDQMAQALGKTLQEVQAAWQPRKEELR